MVAAFFIYVVALEGFLGSDRQGAFILNLHLFRVILSGSSGNLTSAIQIHISPSNDKRISAANQSVTHPHKHCARMLFFRGTLHDLKAFYT